MRMMIGRGGPPHHHHHGPPPDEVERKRVTWKYLRKFLGLIRPYRGKIALVLSLMLLGNATALAIPWGAKLIIDDVLTPILTGRSADLAGARSFLNLIVMVLVGLLGVNVLLSAAQRYLMTATSERLVNDVRRRLHAHVQILPLRFFEKTKTGGIISRVWSDVDQVRSLLFAGYIDCISNLVSAAMILGLLIYLDWRLTIISCLSLPFMAAAVLGWSRKVRPRHKEIREDVAAATSRMQEVISGIKIVRLYRRERHENKIFTQSINAILRKLLAVNVLQMTIESGARVSVGLGIILLLWFGGRQVIAGHLTVGGLMAFYSYLWMLFGPIIGIVVINNLVQQAMASVERIFDLLDEKPDMLDRPGAVGVSDARGEIEFDGVAFAYEDEQYVLRDVSFRVMPGEVAALVGPSGAGKTTVTNLAARFYDPQRGRVLLDGRDIRDIRLSDYRSLIAMVPQETFLFDGTIKENIRYGRLDASDEAIFRAARDANAHDFILEFKDGYDAVVGERGVKLSGGQKQRISIARALLADPRILILDEATSSLDSESEAAIQDALAHLMAGRTTFVIAHRLSTIMHADKTIVLDHGEVKETGPHAELLKAGGLYRRMFVKQFERLRLAPEAGAILHWGGNEEGSPGAA